MLDEPGVSSPYSLGDILRYVKQYWGYSRLRPLQEDAIQAELRGQDSLVVLPTGGGKSLCYQVPPLVSQRTDIVVSPLISLMKDQVDGLLANGYPAAALHSALSASERREAEARIHSGECRLIFLSPERLVTSWFLETVERLKVRSFAIDEAHCISHWGHDFRPEYRQLAILKERIPGASLHAYTATATERVRQDIIEQLALRDPKVLVGDFDRPNLVYRIVPRLDLKKQVLEVIERHRGEAVIVYCISRDDTERLANHLTSEGIRAAYYHAGMTAGNRREAQEAFTKESLDVIVATVAFGMGIDRSNVRCVVHAAMPQSIEHYQQETGRAGRDGLEAECILFFSPADTLRWRSLVEKRSDGSGLLSAAQLTELQLLDEMKRFAAPGKCRHRTLKAYFGQTYPKDNCGACDFCLGESEDLVDSTREAQIILSCVARVGQRFGVGHVVDVIRGSANERIRGLKHDTLSTFGLLKKIPKKTVTNMVYQLLDQEVLGRSSGQYPVLLLNEVSWEVLRGQRSVMMLPIKTKKVRKTTVEKDSWDGVDRKLYEVLRYVRTEIARERNVPPYIIFNDASLRDMARRRPTSSDALLKVSGVGAKKLADFGIRFLEAILEYEDEQQGLR